MSTSPMGTLVRFLRKLVHLDELSDGQLLERFIEGRDEPAVEMLVRRHGPMVLGVCRRILRDAHDADDAFQATFLVLVRKAASIKPADMVGNWLYGVAYQTAVKAKAMTTRRKAREKQLAAMLEPASAAEDRWSDLKAMLDQELHQLPDKYRVLIVLCDIEEKTRQVVARQLGVPEGTVAGRLARARAMLAKRLTRHGFVLSGGALATLLTQHAAAAGIPPSFAAATAQTAATFAAGNTAGLVSPYVATLAEGVLKAMFIAKFKTATALFLSLAIFAVGVVSFAGNNGDGQFPQANGQQNQHNISAQQDQLNAVAQQNGQAKDAGKKDGDNQKDDGQKQENNKDDGQQNNKDDGQQNNKDDGQKQENNKDDGQQNNKDDDKKITGVLKSVDSAKNVIAIYLPGEKADKILSVPQNVPVTVGGKQAAITNLKTGMNIAVHMTKDMKAITRIRATAAQ